MLDYFLMSVIAHKFVRCLSLSLNVNCVLTENIAKELTRKCTIGNIKDD